METKKRIIPAAGMVSDRFPPEQDHKTATFVQNGVLESFTGDIYNYQAEPGNTLLYDVNDQIIGAIPLVGNEKLVFNTNNGGEIGLESNGEYTELVATPDLNLTKEYPMKTGHFRIVNGCERIVYFNDFNNPDRRLNLDRLDDFKDSNGDWDVEKMRLQPRVTKPFTSNFEVVNGGGSLKVGKYFIAVELLDQKLNTAAFSLISSPGVNIYDESPSSSYAQIDGAYPDDVFTAEDGGIPEVNKQIRFTVNNLDVSYPFFRIYVLRRSSTNGITIETFAKSDLIPVSAATERVVISNVNVDTELSDLEKVTIGEILYESSRAMIQVDRRNVRANLKGPSIDYSGFQQAVNDITVAPAVRQVDIASATAVGNAKNPVSYGCLQGDEVYPFGIVFVFDGFVSPVFHIPGRAANASDKDLLEVGPDIDLEQVEMFPAPNGIQWSSGDTIERWKVEKTSAYAQGDRRMGYHECSTRYPDTRDCNGDLLFPYTLDGNGDPVMDFVRHHRTPMREEVHIVGSFDPNTAPDEDKYNLIGVNFSNVTYPHPDIIGHYFVIGKKTELNRTVRDSGWMFPAEFVNDLPPIDSGGVYVSGFKTGNGVADTGTYKYWTIVTPKTLVNEEIFQSGLYIRAGAELQADAGANFLVEGTFTDAATSATVEYRVDKVTYNTDFMFDIYDDQGKNAIIDGGKLIFPRENDETLTVFDDPVANRSFYTKAPLYQLGRELRSATLIGFPAGRSDPFHAIAVTIKSPDYNVHCNLDSIQYVLAEPDMRTLTSTGAIYPPDVAVGSSALTDVADVFGIALPGAFRFSAVHIGLPFESNINFALRHAGTERCRAYYKADGSEESIESFILSQISELDAAVGDRILSLCTASYLYNQDYTTFWPDQFFVSIPQTFDYCLKCANLYPNRVIWSQRSFAEEDLDGYRVYLNEDFTTIGENTGDITNLMYDKNRMLLTTEQSLFQLAPNPQVLNTDLDTAYLGTGDFLSIPPNEMVRTTYGYGGNQGAFNAENTPNGWIYVDQRASQIILFSDRPTDLASKQFGMSRWFSENLPSKLLSQVPDYPYPDSTIGHIGLWGTVDTCFSRYILHKRDYEMVNFAGEIAVGVDPPEQNKVYVRENDKGLFVVDDDGVVFEFRLTDAIPGNLAYENWIINKSWTISFSFDFNVWDSFHSYHPDVMWNDPDTFYSGRILGVWKHLSDQKYLNFFTEDKDFIIEFVVNSERSIQIDSLHWYAKTQEYNTTDKVWMDVDFPTFSALWAYTNRQSTGKLTLLPKTGVYPNKPAWSNTEKDVSYVQEEYRVSGLKDLSTARNVATSDWSKIQSDFPIDKVSNSAVIDVNTNQWNLYPLKDKQIKVRLYFNDTQDRKILIDMIRSLAHINKR